MLIIWSRFHYCHQVFKSSSVSLIQKRLLVKFLELAIDHNNKKEEWEEQAHLKLSEFIRSKRISDDVAQYIIDGMSMGGADIDVESGQLLWEFSHDVFFIHLWGR